MVASCLRIDNGINICFENCEVLYITEENPLTLSLSSQSRGEGTGESSGLILDRLISEGMPLWLRSRFVFYMPPIFSWIVRSVLRVH